MQKNKKFVVINSKGGCGKSTTAIQILIPYLYTRGGGKKVDLVEMDVQNMNAETFSSSELFSPEYIDVEKPIDAYLCEKLVSDGSVVFDIGGNSSSANFLKKLSEISDIFIGYIDAFFIPLGRAEQDFVNAMKTYDELKTIAPNTKIIFVLAQAIPEYDVERSYSFFFGDGEEQKGVYDREKEPAILTLEYRPIEIGDSNVFGLTVYEMGNRAIAPIEDEIRAAISEKNLKKMQDLNKKIMIVKEQSRFFEQSIEPNFQKIDEFLGEGKAQKVEKIKAEKK